MYAGGLAYAVTMSRVLAAFGCETLSQSSALPRLTRRTQ